MAINFPDSPTNGDQHTSGGVTWTWDGTTWKADGITSSYVLPTAAANVLGGVKVGSGLAINSGVLSASASAITVQEEGSSLSTAATTLNFVGPNVTATGTGADKTITVTGSSGLQSRTTANGTTASIANNTAADLTIAAAKTYVLHEIEVDAAAWVVVYTDTTSRTNDASRTELEDPAAGAGIIAEIVTTGAVSQKLTPGTVGFNLDGTPSTNVYLKVVNKSGSTGTVQVTLKYLTLEA